jgi:hypothetical protein
MSQKERDQKSTAEDEEEEEGEPKSADQLLTQLESIERGLTEGLLKQTVEPKVSVPLAEVESPVQTEARESHMVMGVRPISSEVRAILPPWVEKPWRWIDPEEGELRVQWLGEWGNLLMEWGRVQGLHLVKIEEVRREFPFKQPLIKKELSIEQLEAIGDHLTEKKKAKWWDTKKRRLRLYWMPLEDVAEEVYEWAEDQGLPVATIFDLQQSGRIWSSVPRRELLLVLEFLVKTKRCDWTDKEKQSVSFRYDY